MGYLSLEGAVKSTGEGGDKAAVSYVRELLTDGGWVAESVAAARDLYDHADEYAALHTEPVRVIDVPEQSAVHTMSVICRMLLEFEATQSDVQFFEGLQGFVKTMSGNRILDLRVRLMQETARVAQGRRSKSTKKAGGEKSAQMQARRMAVLGCLPPSSGKALKNLGNVLRALTRAWSRRGGDADSILVGWDSQWSDDTIGRDVVALREDGLVHEALLLRTPAGDEAVTRASSR